MSKRGFMVGDRVAVYREDRRVVGEVVDINAGGKGVLEMKVDQQRFSICATFAHPKQCRRIVKVPAKELWVVEWDNGRRETFWDKANALSTIKHYSSAHTGTLVHFREVRTPK